MNSSKLGQNKVILAAVEMALAAGFCSQSHFQRILKNIPSWALLNAVNLPRSLIRIEEFLCNERLERNR
jgi:hypothetical protein